MIWNLSIAVEVAILMGFVTVLLSIMMLHLSWLWWIVCPSINRCYLSYGNILGKFWLWINEYVIWINEYFIYLHWLLLNMNSSYFCLYWIRFIFLLSYLLLYINQSIYSIYLCIYVYIFSGDIKKQLSMIIIEKSSYTLKYLPLDLSAKYPAKSTNLDIDK